jgi:allophanate hydrolase subunit 2
VRVLPGVHPDDLALVAGRPWTVAPDSDRMGLRLEPADGAPPPRLDRHVTSHGVVQGAVQLPPGGGPIVLLPDHQPTGGYPVVGVVASADLAALGQAAPGDRLALVPTGPDEARAALLAQRARWDAAVAVLRADARWEDLWGSAGA